MKLGILSYDKKPLALDGRDVQNLGDWIQRIVIEDLLKDMEYKGEICHISRDEIDTYKSDEYIFLVYNGFSDITKYLHTYFPVLPPTKYIIPIYISFSLHNLIWPDSLYKHFKSYEPIGCMDEETLVNMRNHGIKAYLSGCVTALFPRRPNQPDSPKVLLIDTPKSLEPYIPNEYKGHIEYMTHTHRITRTTGDNAMQDIEAEEVFNKTKAALEYYKNNATLIVTSKLHAASTCMAMGIPVILVSEQFDGKYAWIDKFLPLYTIDRFADIDWHPEPIDYEEAKHTMRQSFIRHILTEYNKYNDLYSVSEFWENRNAHVYNKRFIDSLRELPFNNKSIRYAIWGVTPFSSMLYRIIISQYPEWTCVGIIDEKCTSSFEGHDILIPDAIYDLPNNTVFIIVPESAHAPVSKLLDENNKYYVCLGQSDFWFSENCHTL